MCVLLTCVQKSKLVLALSMDTPVFVKKLGIGWQLRWMCSLEKLAWTAGTLCVSTNHAWVSMPYTSRPWYQGSWGQHGAFLGPTGPRWAPCWPHELCYMGCWQTYQGLRWSCHIQQRSFLPGEETAMGDSIINWSLQSYTMQLITPDLISIGIQQNPRWHQSLDE